MSTNKADSTVKPPLFWRLRLVVALTFILAVLACGASGFLMYQFWMNTQSRPVQHASTPDYHALVSDIQQQWQVAHQKLNQSVNAIKAEQAALSKERLPHSTLQSLNLMTVKATLTIAQSLLAARQSPQLISQALDQAINNLPVMGEGSEVIRQLLARTQAQLLALPTLQTEQVLTQLDQYYAALAQLHFIQPVSKQPQTDTVQGGWDWHHPTLVAKQAWQWVKSVVVIRKNDNIGTHLLDQASQLNALAMLNLKWNEVRWYALTHASQYQASMRDLITCIQQVTRSDAAQQQLVGQLKSMLHEVVAIPSDQLNAIGQSLQHADNLVDQLRVS